VVTPVLIAPDRAVLVLRGWLPAADGVSADVAGARPDVSADPAHYVDLDGVALPGERALSIPPRTRSIGGLDRLVLGTLVIEQASESLPYELLPFYVLAADRGSEAGAPVPVPLPEPSDGPHLFYAIQWFSFATIALVGAAVYYWTRRRTVQQARSAS
jgi:surfeit locus 1 family protein